MSALLQLAYNAENKIVSVFEVDTGIKCNCYCPECGEKLEAKNKGKSVNMILMPNQKSAHFAHISGKICKYAAETALHKLAKSVLAETKKIKLPKYIIWGVKLSDEICVQFDNVLLEKSVSKDETWFIPDATLIKSEKKLLVEFYKSHLVDNNKLEKINNIGLSTIQVDINSIDPIKNGLPNREDMSNFLEKECSFTTWLYNTKRNELYAKRIKQGELNIIERSAKEKIDQTNEEQERELQAERRLEKEARIEKWITNQIEQGFELLKVYRFGSKYDKVDTVFCPKKPKNENRLEASDCRFCKYYSNIYFSRLEDAKIICGYKAKLTPNNRSDVKTD